MRGGAAAGAEPLPYLLICAFHIANAASFVLPISNPANLVIFGAGMPPLALWLSRFALPSIVSIALTFAALRFTLRGQLRGGFERGARTRAADPRRRSRGAWRRRDRPRADRRLGAWLASASPTFAAGVLTASFILIGARQYRLGRS